MSLFRMCAVISVQVVNIVVFDQYVSIMTHIVNSCIFMCFTQEFVNIILAIKFKLVYSYAAFIYFNILQVNLMYMYCIFLE
jgi:hypothetical protein